MDTNTIALLCAGVMLVSAGCGKSAASGGKDDPSEIAAAAAEQAADRQLSSKLSHYIQCFNDLSADAQRSREWYLSWVGPQGVTGKERSISGVDEVGDGPRCFEALDQARKLKPDLPEVHAAADAYRKAAEPLIALTAKAHRYYDEKDYKDDKFAAAKEMHEPLVAAYGTFAAADRALRALVVPVNEQIAERRLARLSQDPARRLEYLVERSMSAAKKLVEAGDVATLAELDEQSYQKLLSDYDAAVTELETFAKSDPKAEGSLRLFPGAARDLLKVGKDVLRRKRDKDDFNKEFFSKSSPEMVEGHPAQLVKQYNRLVDANNFNAAFGS